MTTTPKSPTPRLSQSRLALMKERMTAWILANPELVEIGIAKVREEKLARQEREAAKEAA